MIKARGTQQQFIDKGISLLTSKSTKKSIMVAPVAYGKSICIANIVLGLDAPSIVLQPNQELLKQNYSKYISYGYHATICSVSMKVKQMQSKMYTEIDGELVRCDELSKVTYATIGSIVKYIKEIKALGVKYIIIDECHISSNVKSQLRKFLKSANIKNVLGVTATAITLRSSFFDSYLKMMDRTSTNLFTSLAHVVQISEVVVAGYWTKLEYFKLITAENALEYNTTGSEYTQESMKKFYDINRNAPRCVKATERLVRYGKKSILIFVPSVADALHLERKIPNSRAVYGNMDKKDRIKVIDDFKSLKLKVVINVEILTTGFDHPQLDAIIMARPTASIALYYQILGRITRPHTLKPVGTIIDLSGNVSKFGPIESLNYDYIDGYGWGLFSDDILLSDFPLSATTRPTKEILIKSVSEEGIVEVKEHSKVKIWFGKYKGLTLEAIPNNYLTFMLDNFEFDTNEIKRLRHSIEIYLKLK